MPTSYTVLLEPGHELTVDGETDVLTAALAAGFPLPHSCRAGRCASCKAKLLSGEIGYPDDRLPPGIVAAEAARGEVLLCQARPRSDLRIQVRAIGSPLGPAHGVLVEGETPLSTGSTRVTLRMLGATPLNARPGQFIDVETATGERERVAVVAATPETLDVELHEFAAEFIVRVRGPFDSPR
jgi:CDP-4-dehydro-6-deoxyglucose reductase